jgi:hypothetical protein
MLRLDQRHRQRDLGPSMTSSPTSMCRHSGTIAAALWMSAPTRFSRKVVGVEAAAALAELGDPGPDLVSIGAYRDRSGGNQVDVVHQFVAGQGQIQLVVRGAPPQQPSSQQRKTRQSQSPGHRSRTERFRWTHLGRGTHLAQLRGNRAICIAPVDLTRLSRPSWNLRWRSAISPSPDSPGGRSPNKRSPSHPVW